MMRMPAWRDDRGVVAVAFAISLPALLAATAMAVDLGMEVLVRNQLQSAADAAALAAATRLDDETAATARALEYAQLNVPDSFGTVTTAADVSFGLWDPSTRTFEPPDDGVNAVRVRAHHDLPRFFASMFGWAPASIDVEAIAVRLVNSTYEPPVAVNLAPEAADYNEIYAYCFAYQDSGPAADRRSQMTAIANNKIGVYTGIVFPQCKKDESLSFRLLNIRESRHLADPYASTKPKYNHYSDTVLVDGVDVYNFQYNSNPITILETVRCDSLAACTTTQSAGGDIPFGKNREPQRDDRPCIPGKYKYYGWEDRPPGLGWTDKDYDDIRIVMSCPKGPDLEYTGYSRLVR